MSFNTRGEETKIVHTHTHTHTPQHIFHKDTFIFKDKSDAFVDDYLGVNRDEWVKIK